ncbi:hypothetical protein J0910_21745 [Nocardiopsis sp. CNT-189]|uniref:hypothetical protein n=1 Tax=Nocardiopsis oceanisediminis TaxID=2816862 RepID=UPI003B39608F
MSDRTWEYVPDAQYAVGGLSEWQRTEVEVLAQRITDAVGARRVGHAFDITESVSNLKSFAEGNVVLWYQEDYREDVILVFRVTHFLAD